jgi:glycosyltransferase involved in cell wall biosynthesis
MKNRILVFVPTYNCEKQISRVIDQLEQNWVINSVSKIIIVDNKSQDNTVGVINQRIRSHSDGLFQLLQNSENYGLGGSHKVAFQYAAVNNYDWLIVLHGDDQGSISDFRQIIVQGGEENVDAYLGSRFMKGAHAIGYSTFRKFGNAVFNLIYSLFLGFKVYDLGAGLNMYRVRSLDWGNFYKYPDNLTFNCALLCCQILRRDRLIFKPISWREDDQISNVKLLRQSIQTFLIALRALFLRKYFLKIEHREKFISKYEWNE